MASKNTRKAASNMRASSVAASVGNQDSKKRVISVWPEWNDADVNAEKWEVAHRGPKGKEDKGKSPVVQHFFDDPEGKLDIPSLFKVTTWKRPQDFITDKTPTIVEDETKFDLMSLNEYIHESELMRWVTSQIQALWRQCEVRPSTSGTHGSPDIQTGPDGLESGHTWHPWEHIYAINKVAKGPNIPVYNPHGKYVVKLYWMGAWRKIIIDDTMPFDDQDRLLLPATTLQQELWPMLLSKALIKVANLDLTGGSSSCEFGDFSVIHCLTGWLPEVIPLQNDNLSELWDLVKAALPEFKLPEPVVEPEGEGAEGKDANSADNTKDEKSDKDKEKSTLEKPDAKPSKDSKGKETKGKDDKKDKKDKDKDKDKGKEKSIIQEEAPLPEHPELMVFASYSGPPKYPVRASILTEMANASECLRKTGLSHLYPHPVMVTQSRACPLEPPPPQEKIPAWKLIRPRKKRGAPSDEGSETEEEVPIQCVKITSPFLNYKVSPIPIPTDTHRPSSALRRGSSRISSRPGTANAEAIQEGDENSSDVAAPTPPAPVQKTEEPEPSKQEDSREEQPKSNVPVKDHKRVASRSASKIKPDSISGDSITSAKTGAKPAVPKSGGKRAASSAGKAEKETGKTGTGAEQKKDGKAETAVPKDKQATTNLSEPAVDSTAAGGPTADGSEPIPDGTETSADSSNQPESDTKNSQVWMGFEHFCRCFKTLHVFHKSNTYPSNYKHTDMKTGAEERTTSYLFVDSLTPTEIVVSFSALSRWNEPLPSPPKEESKTGLKSSRDKTGDRDSKAEVFTVESSSVVDGGGDLGPVIENLQPGLLVAEPYSWKSLVSGQPILRLRTTATRAAVLSLQEGRHLLKFSMSSPYGYHLHLSSSYTFVFGDEEKVMEQLTKESCRFIDNAVQVMGALGKCVTSFSDPVLYPQAYDEYFSSHCPYRNNNKVSKQQHHKVYNEALYNMLRKVLADPTPEIAFAWRAFNFDCTTKNILGLPYGSNSRPATGVTTSDRGSAGGKKGTKKKETTESKVDHWKNREATPDELVAVVKLQKCWRGAYVRKIKTSRTPGTEVNQKVQDVLMKCWQTMEPNQEQNGLLLFRALFKSKPDLMNHYPFSKDEWNKISFCDYQGTYTDQPPNTWFVLFREIFHAPEEMVCVPKLYTSIPSCTLRVVNNDTGVEIPNIFHKVAPHMYKKNKHGYTFFAEVRTPDQPLMAGKWRLRIIGALSSLPAPNRNEINNSFISKELRDYYVPNEKNIIFRYNVRVQEEHQLSFQLMTSKSDVYVKLQVLDQEREILNVVGKGHVVLPSYIFQKEPVGEDDGKRSNSRASLKGKGSRDNLGKSSKRIGSGRSTRSSHSRHSISSIDDELEKPHKYIVQAQVLHNSWPLSESQWTFVGMLKELEKNEIKLVQKENPPSPQRGEKQSAASVKTSKEKGAKGSKGKDKDKGSRPPSQQFDASKPNWTLRVVSDAACVDDLEIKKDNERIDEIRAMKKAWEEADPGRAAKATQSRLQYINNHVIKTKPDDEEGDSAAPDLNQPITSESLTSPVPTLGLDALDSDAVLTLEPPVPQAPKEILPLIDLTPFLRNTNVSPRMQDEEEIQAQLEIKQQEIQAYREHRLNVENYREQEWINRNLLKAQQLEMFERMQIALDLAREEVNDPRQAFRQKFLEAEKKRLEEIAAQEAALRAEMDKAPSPKGRKSAKGDKKTPSAKKKK